MTAPVHATLCALAVGGGWRGALLRGPSGAGKSDLALRLVEAGWRLVADDRVRLWASGGRLYGAAPPTLAGLMELRGQGMARLPPLPWVQVSLVVELGPAPSRQPAEAWATLAGVRLSSHALAPLDASAPARLRLLLCGAL